VSEWRRHAINEFPEMRQAIDEAQSVHGVFFELLPALHGAYREPTRNESLIRRIYAFAEWSSSAEHADISGAAMTSFYEHLPEFRTAWLDLPNRVSPASLASIRDYLRGYLLPAEYARAISELDQRAG
jgi:hypothetical protein